MIFICLWCQANVDVYILEIKFVNFGIVKGEKMQRKCILYLQKNTKACSRFNFKGCCHEFFFDFRFIFESWGLPLKLTILCKCFPIR
jgi:hypothetical protein